jgi:hypothetical protein
LFNAILLQQQQYLFWKRHEFSLAVNAGMFGEALDQELLLLLPLAAEAIMKAA